MSARQRPIPKPSPPSPGGSSWPGILLTVSCLTLVAQLLPASWWAVIAGADPRTWTWKVYAGICAGLIVVLVAVRSIQENSNGAR